MDQNPQLPTQTQLPTATPTTSTATTTMDGPTPIPITAPTATSDTDDEEEVHPFRHPPRGQIPLPPLRAHHHYDPIPSHYHMPQIANEPAPEFPPYYARKLAELQHLHHEMGNTEPLNFYLTIPPPPAPPTSAEQSILKDDPNPGLSAYDAFEPQQNFLYEPPFNPFAIAPGTVDEYSNFNPPPPVPNTTYANPVPVQNVPGLDDNMSSNYFDGLDDDYDDQIPLPLPVQVTIRYQDTLGYNSTVNVREGYSQGYPPATAYPTATADQYDPKSTMPTSSSSTTSPPLHAPSSTQSPPTTITTQPINTASLNPCPRCQQSVDNDVVHFEKHSLWDSGRGPYRCTLCQMGFLTLKGFGRHIYYSHNVDKIPATLTNFTGDTPWAGDSFIMEDKDLVGLVTHENATMRIRRGIRVPPPQSVDIADDNGGFGSNDNTGGCCAADGVVTIGNSDGIDASNDMGAAYENQLPDNVENMPQVDFIHHADHNHHYNNSTFVDSYYYYHDPTANPLPPQINPYDYVVFNDRPSVDFNAPIIYLNPQEAGTVQGIRYNPNDWVSTPVQLHHWSGTDFPHPFADDHYYQYRSGAGAEGHNDRFNDKTHGNSANASHPLHHPYPRNSNHGHNNSNTHRINTNHNHTNNSALDNTSHHPNHHQPGQSNNQIKFDLMPPVPSFGKIPKSHSINITPSAIDLDELNDDGDYYYDPFDDYNNNNYNNRSSNLHANINNNNDMINNNHNNTTSTRTQTHNNNVSNVSTSAPSTNHILTRNGGRMPSPRTTTTSSSSQTAFQTRPRQFQNQDQTQPQQIQTKPKPKPKNAPGLQCDRCPAHFRLTVGFQNHQLLHQNYDQNISTYSCKSCKLCWPTVSPLINHYKTKTCTEGQEWDPSIQLNICPKCPFPASSSHSICHSNYDKGIGHAPHRCETCSAAWLHRTGLTNHYEARLCEEGRKAMETRGGSCTRCGFKYVSRVREDSHMALHVSFDKTGDEFVPARCNICQLAWGSFTSYTNHLNKRLCSLGIDFNTTTRSSAKQDS